MQVRAAEVRDIDHLVSASIAMGQETEGRGPAEAAVRAAVTAALADPRKARYFIAEDASNILGSLFVTYEWSDWTAGWYWWIQGVYVDPAARRQGVLRRLVDAVHDAARAEGDVREVRLYVAQGNETARAAYQRLGFTKQSYAIYAHPLDA